MMLTVHGFWFLMVLLPFQSYPSGAIKPVWPAINIGIYQQQPECQTDMLRAFKTKGLPEHSRMACLWLPAESKV